MKKNKPFILLFFVLLLFFILINSYQDDLSFLYIFDNQMTLVKVVSLFISTITSIIIATFIHELGHLVFGLISGYRFISFRLFSLVVKKEQRKLVLKRFSLKGTMGQCLLAPPKKDKLPIFWYNAGGVIFNGLSSLISLPLVIIIPNNFIKLLLLIFIVINLILVVINWMDQEGITNDGQNYRELKNHLNSRIAMRQLLDRQEALSNNMTFTTLNFDVLTLEQLDLTKSIQVNYALLLSLYRLLTLDFEKSKEICLKIQEIYPHDKSMLSYMNQSYLYFINLILDSSFDNKMPDFLAKSMTQKSNDPLFNLFRLYNYFIKHQTISDVISNDFQQSLLKNPTPGQNKDVVNLKNHLFKSYEI